LFTFHKGVVIDTLFVNLSFYKGAHLISFHKQVN